MGCGPVASKKVFTVTLTVDPDTLSEDAKEWNCEGIFNLLDNLVRDGLAHAEPNLSYNDIRVTMEDAVEEVINLKDVTPDMIGEMTFRVTNKE